MFFIWPCNTVLATHNPCYRSRVQRRKKDIEFFPTLTFTCLNVCATSCIYMPWKPYQGIKGRSWCWEWWMTARCCGPCGDHLHCWIFGPSACGGERVKWPWQPVASFWPSQASIAPGSGSSAYSPTSWRPHVDKGWGSCRQAFGEIKTWPNFLQSMSEKGDEAFLCFFSTPAVLELAELPVCLSQHHGCPLPPLQSPPQHSPATSPTRGCTSSKVDTNTLGWRSFPVKSNCFFYLNTRNLKKKKKKNIARNENNMQFNFNLQDVRKRFLILNLVPQ